MKVHSLFIFFPLAHLGSMLNFESPRRFFSSCKMNRGLTHRFRLQNRREILFTVLQKRLWRQSNKLFIASESFFFKSSIKQPRILLSNVPMKNLFNWYLNGLNFISTMFYFSPRDLLFLATSSATTFHLHHIYGQRNSFQPMQH